MRALGVLLVTLVFVSSQPGTASAGWRISWRSGSFSITIGVLHPIDPLPPFPPPQCPPPHLRPHELASPQLAQSRDSMALTAKGTTQTASGAKVVRLRVGTRDVVEAIKEDLGLVGPGGSLVVRRDIEDLDFAESVEYLLFDGNLYGLRGDDFGAASGPNLPGSFFGRADTVTTRSSEGAIVALTQERTLTMRWGDFTDGGLESTLAGLERRSARLATSSNCVTLGFVFSGGIVTVFGGLRIPELGPQVLIQTGTLRRGPEQLVP